MEVSPVRNVNRNTAREDCPFLEALPLANGLVTVDRSAHSRALPGRCRFDVAD